jgi:prepilin-type N-terminal cleavage/methylation domain-containing protein
MRSKQTGFTLVEVVISLAVLAIAFFGMISVITYTSRTNAQVRERMYATRAAEKKIEQMINCANFADLDLFRAQTEGLGWEQVLETDSDGVVKQALMPIPLAKMPPNVLPSGFNYNNPAPNPKAVLFVRFPLDTAGGAYSAKDSGKFCDSYTLADNTNPNSARTYIDLDLDSKGTYGSSLGISVCNVMPVIVEVLWSGVSGPINVLRYRYTFYKKS